MLSLFCRIFFLRKWGCLYCLKSLILKVCICLFCSLYLWATYLLIKTTWGILGHAWDRGTWEYERWALPDNAYLLITSIAYPLLYNSQVKVQDHNENWGILMFWGICQAGYTPSIIAWNGILKLRTTSNKACFGMKSEIISHFAFYCLYPICEVDIISLLRHGRIIS